ncbi:LuxR C-terminal-related transcriptional regulator [Phenylobacterium sp.]|uniref:LuxR C-terminal-related transcriptional regulator n=1 Tax=Phenylobacterium sp. TaxID=1871053 RepID=UPI0011FE7ACA|nr:LuxR C-terminal-related transcriptional regulator [Phenylobacterium sp.]THD57484.1 MAG: hypothetical protein E8A49_22870 [Phenylobacterium sp.]
MTTDRSGPPRPGSFPDAIAAVSGAPPGAAPTLDDDGFLQSVADALGGLALDLVPSAMAPAAALSFAVVDSRGRARAADASFLAMFSDDLGVPALLRLLQAAGAGEPSVGLVQTLAGVPAAVCAALPDQAVGWPMPAELRAALAGGGRRWALLAYVPLRLPKFAEDAAAAFGLTNREVRVAVALLEAPTLEIAAARLRIGRETARDALNGAMRKMGVRRTAALVRRLTDLVCQVSQGEDLEALGAAMNLTPGEARVARLTARGETAARVAATLGVTRETVKTHLRSAFAKTGLSQAKDLSRAASELGALERIARAAEIAPLPDLGPGRLRMVARADGRRVAFMDYGPNPARPLIFQHALASGRTLPPALCRGLQAAGWRPLVPQRPGYGLTDIDDGDYLQAAAGDVAAILDLLRQDAADIFARDIAAAPTLAFAKAHPDRVGRALLLNPQAAAHPGRRRFGVSIASGILRAHPELIHPFFEVLRRQIRSERVATLLRESFKGGVPSDIAVLDDPALLAWMVADIQAMVARTALGVIRERLVYAGGWTPPSAVGGKTWTVVSCAELGDEDWRQPWSDLPDVRFKSLPSGGLLLPYSHPDAFIRLLSEM